jgi:hypothetical protein
MVDTLPGGQANTESSSLSTPEAPAVRDISKISDIAAEIRQTEAARQSDDGSFFRGFVIFLVIAAVFWVVVFGLLHLL